MDIVCLGLSHRTAAVELRERFAVPEAELARVMTEIGTLPGVAESVVVSTCNRVEYYAAASNPDEALASVQAFLGSRTGQQEALARSTFGIPVDCATPEAPFYALNGRDSIAHLFRVVSGLDSMVIGETEILGQVKKAYAAASSAGATSRHLNKLFQRAFNVAKEVRTKTNITSGPVSVGSVAIDLAERIFGELAACHAMILGAGEMSEITARSLLSRGVERMIVSNRSPERAEALAAEMRGKAVPFSDWPRHLQEADILISSTAAPHPIVTPETVAQAMEVRPERPLFIIDLAVPRDVEPSVNAIDGVYLYDIDSLQAIARQGIEMRRREITACEALIERHVADFLHWLDADPAARSRPPTKLH